MVTYFPITQAGRDHLQAEVEQLKHDRPQYIQRLAAAAALGDRSENAEYSAAKRDLRQLEGRLRYLDKLLRYGQPVPAPAGDVAAIGTTITVSFGPGDEALTAWWARWRPAWRRVIWPVIRRWGRRCWSTPPGTRWLCTRRPVITRSPSSR